MTVVTRDSVTFQAVTIALDGRNLHYRGDARNKTITLVPPVRGKARFLRRHAEFLKRLGFVVVSQAVNRFCG